MPDERRQDLRGRRQPALVPDLDHARLLTALANARSELAQLRAQLDTVTGSMTWRVARCVHAAVERRPWLRRAALGFRVGVTRILRRPRTRSLSADGRLLLESGFFDPAWYAARYADAPREPQSAAEHYLAQQGAAQRMPGPHFDPAWYIAQEPGAAEGNALLHYLRIGRHRMRFSTASAQERAEAARRAALGLDLPTERPRLAIGFVGQVSRDTLARAVRSARLAAGEAGLEKGFEIIWAGEGALAPERVRAVASEGDAQTSAAMHNRLLREAAGAGADLYLATDARGIFDPGCINALVRMSAASGHAALVAANDFPQENPKAFDPVTFETGWAGGGCLLVPVALANRLGPFEPALECFSQVDFSWRARQAGYGVKVCLPALFLLARDPWEEQDWISSRALADGYRLASLWGQSEAAARMLAELRHHGGDAAPADQGGQHREPRFSDFAHGLGFAPARW